MKALQGPALIFTVYRVDISEVEEVAPRVCVDKTRQIL